MSVAYGHCEAVDIGLERTPNRKRRRCDYPAIEFKIRTMPHLRCSSLIRPHYTPRKYSAFPWGHGYAAPKRGLASPHGGRHLFNRTQIIKIPELLRLSIYIKR